MPSTDTTMWIRPNKRLACQALTRQCESDQMCGWHAKHLLDNVNLTKCAVGMPSTDSTMWIWPHVQLACQALTQYNVDLTTCAVAMPSTDTIRGSDHMCGCHAKHWHQNVDLTTCVVAMPSTDTTTWIRQWFSHSCCSSSHHYLTPSHTSVPKLVVSCRQFVFLVVQLS